MTGLTPLGGTTRLAASSTLKWPGGMSGSGTCLMVTMILIWPPVSIVTLKSAVILTEAKNKVITTSCNLILRSAQNDSLVRQLCLLRPVIPVERIGHDLRQVAHL